MEKILIIDQSIPEKQLPFKISNNGHFKKFMDHIDIIVLAERCDVCELFIWNMHLNQTLILRNVIIMWHNGILVLIWLI